MICLSSAQNFFSFFVTQVCLFHASAGLYDAAPFTCGLHFQSVWGSQRTWSLMTVQAVSGAFLHREVSPMTSPRRTPPPPSRFLCGRTSRALPQRQTIKGGEWVSEG